jgi:hypothetical protein
MLKQQFQQSFHVVNHQVKFIMSRQMPYVPMGKPQKQVTFGRMAEILAKNAKPKVDVEVAKKEPLQWNEPVKTGPHSGYMESACGRFTVTKSAHELGWIYCAHDRVTKNDQGGMATCLGCKPTKEEALALIEAAR